MMMAALFTRTSIRPNVSIVDWMILIQSDSFDTSPMTTRGDSPAGDAALHLSATALTLDSFLPVTGKRSLGYLCTNRSRSAQAVEV